MGAYDKDIFQTCGQIIGIFFYILHHMLHLLLLAPTCDGIASGRRRRHHTGCSAAHKPPLPLGLGERSTASGGSSCCEHRSPVGWQDHPVPSFFLNGMQLHKQTKPPLDRLEINGNTTNQSTQHKNNETLHNTMGQEPREIQSPWCSLGKGSQPDRPRDASLQYTSSMAGGNAAEPPPASGSRTPHPLR